MFLVIFASTVHVNNILCCRCVVLIPEESEDMWHAYNLISVGDVLKSTTIRLVYSKFVRRLLYLTDCLEIPQSDLCLQLLTV